MSAFADVKGQQLHSGVLYLRAGGGVGGTLGRQQPVRRAAGDGGSLSGEAPDETVPEKSGKKKERFFKNFMDPSGNDVQIEV